MGFFLNLGFGVVFWCCGVWYFVNLGVWCFILFGFRFRFVFAMP